MADQFDLAVLGAGPGGYVAAIRAAQLGMNVICIDKNQQLGGTCLRIGCIPSKALLESSHHYYAARSGMLAAHGVKVEGVGLDLFAMLKRKDKVVDQLTSGVAFLFRKHKVTATQGTARLLGGGRVEVTSPEGKTTQLSANNILIATGSVPATIPGVEPDGGRIGTSTEALSYQTVPEHLVVIGAGYIGLELGSVWARLGSQVTVLEYLPRLLPTVDDEVAKMALKLFKRQGIRFQFGVRVTGATATTNSATVTYEDDGSSHDVACDRVLVATGRRPNTAGLGIEAVGIQLDRRGFIVVDHRYHTGVENIFAIGDVIPGPMLAHKAEEEGIAAVENISGSRGHVNYDAIPGIVYTHPEIASVGKSEQQLEDEGIAYRKGSFSFKANGRAKAMNETDGFVKILAHAESDRILGVHVIGSRAGELIAEAAVAVEFQASAEDLARSVHAHPTLSEAVKEAALAVAGRQIHA